MVEEVMFKHHPGRDYVKVICDICGGQFRQKDTVKITDRYNSQYGMIVCLKDADETNPQTLPNRHVDRPISSPGDLRPERADSFATNENDDRVPGAPRNPFTQVNPINAAIDLFWQGPEDTGSSGIIGYVIKRANPQLAYYDTIESNTNTEYTYYQDLTADVSLEYSYKVAAINSFGTGAYSAEFFWPVNRVAWSDTEYLIISNDALVIDGNPLRMNHTESGIL